mmetsp:Transcript_41092/g.130580  ORF Transcript_41092/g.130580 Transcript_41092/m.130580 type:complete len:249 (-) Transcript_41092:67-813(-)
MVHAPCCQPRLRPNLSSSSFSPLPCATSWRSSPSRSTSSATGVSCVRRCTTFSAAPRQSVPKCRCRSSVVCPGSAGERSTKRVQTSSRCSVTASATLQSPGGTGCSAPCAKSSCASRSSPQSGQEAWLARSLSACPATISTHSTAPHSALEQPRKCASLSTWGVLTRRQSMCMVQSARYCGQPRRPCGAALATLTRNPFRRASTPAAASTESAVITEMPPAQSAVTMREKPSHMCHRYARGRWVFTKR